VSMVTWGSSLIALRRRLTTASTRPRISMFLIENLDGFEVQCAAGDAGRYADTIRNDLGLNRYTPLAYHCVHAVRRDVRVYGGASPAPRRRTVPAAADGFDAPARARTDHQRVRWPPQDPVGPAWVGKRGGVRVIYYWAPVEAVFYMLYIYAKTEQGDLTPQQVRALAKVVREEFK